MTDQPWWPRGSPPDEEGHGQGGRFRGDGPEVEGWVQRLSEQIEPAIRYYHGTVVEDLEEVLPASAHGRGVIFTSDTDPDYAYATGSETDAWYYAELAWNATSSGIPRVFEVEPIDWDDIEEDPPFDQHGRSRSTRDQDVRSRTGWRVVRGLRIPEAWGDPEDWR